MKLKKKIEKYVKQNTLLHKKIIFLSQIIGDFSCIYLNIDKNLNPEDIFCVVIYCILFNKNVLFKKISDNFEIKNTIFNSFTDIDITTSKLEYPTQNLFSISDNITTITYKNIKFFCNNYIFTTTTKTLNLLCNNLLYYFFFIPFCVVQNIDCLTNNSDYIVIDTASNYPQKTIQIINHTNIEKLDDNLDTLFYSNRLGFFLLQNVVINSSTIEGTLLSCFSIKDNLLLLNDKDDKNTKNIVSVPLPNKYIFTDNKLYIYPKSSNFITNTTIYESQKFKYYKFIYITYKNSINIQTLKLYYMKICNSIKKIDESTSQLLYNSSNIDYTKFLYIQFIDSKHIVVILHDILESNLKQIISILSNNYNNVSTSIEPILSEEYGYFRKIKFCISLITFIIINLITWFFKKYKSIESFVKNTNIHFQFTKNEIDSIQKYLQSIGLTFTEHFYILLLISCNHTISSDYGITLINDQYLLTLPNICNDFDTFNSVISLKNNEKIKNIVEKYCTKKIHISYIHFEDLLSQNILIEKINIYQNDNQPDLNDKYDFYITCSLSNNFLNIDISYNKKEDVDKAKKIIDYIFYIIT